MVKKADLIGKRFGRLIVKEYAGSKNGCNQWLCECDCGGIKVATTGNLNKGNTRSCGCLTKENLIGQRFGRLLVLREEKPIFYKSGSKGFRWLCQCDCGKQKIILGSCLKSGNTTSCGCYKTEISRVNMVGEKHGKLTILSEAGRGEYGDALWKCKCDCGKIFVASGHRIRRGETTSCGCYAREQHIKRTTTHGMAKTRLYKEWQGMKQRCNNPKTPKFYNYGGRGISYCEEWEDFSNFQEWALSNGYSDSLTLDRIDVNGNYGPNNCRWVTNLEQQNNKRNNQKYTYKDETLTVAELARKYSIRRGTLNSRLVKGLPIEEAIEKPIDVKYANKRSKHYEYTNT